MQLSGEDSGCGGRSDHRVHHLLSRKDMTVGGSTMFIRHGRCVPAFAAIALNALSAGDLPFPVNLAFAVG